MAASRYCAYNETRERFVCIDVEGADFSAASLNSRLPDLTPGCGKGLWILPFRGISTTSVRVPIDLVYLDENLVVLASVESFPIFQAPASMVPASSVLALPGGTITSALTLPGDRLILCAPEELKRQLMQRTGTKTDGGVQQSGGSGAGAPLRIEQAARRSTGNVLPWVSQARPNMGDEAGRDEAEPNKTVSADGPLIGVPTQGEPEPVQPAEWKPPDSRNWLQRFLKPEPPDPRGAQRESLPGLAVYFFTGGTPTAHGIRDISATGLFVFTEERWYLGTVIRMTVADVKNPAPERRADAYQIPSSLSR